MTRELDALSRVLPVFRPRPMAIPPGGPPGGRKAQQVEAVSPRAGTLGIGQPTCGRPSGPRVVPAACPQAPGAAQRLPAATPRGIGCAAESAPPGNEERGSLCSRSGWASHVREPRCRSVLRKQSGSRISRRPPWKKKRRGTEEGAGFRRTKRGSGRGGVAATVLFRRWSWGLLARCVPQPGSVVCGSVGVTKGGAVIQGFPLQNASRAPFSPRAGDPV